MDPAVIVAIISVLGTVLVAVLSILVPVVIDCRKSKRERDAVEVKMVDETALELLRHFSRFRHWTINDIEKSGDGTIQQAYTDLQVKHYAWEQAIWSRLSASDRERVRKLRKTFGDVHTPEALKGQVSDLSEEILSLTKAATKHA